MEENTDKIIQDQLETLPINIRKALSLVPWKARISDISKREGLDPEQTEKLQNETMLILYGFLPTESYIDNIIDQVKVSGDQAERIAEIVSKEIITDLEEKFEQIDKSSDVEEGTQKPEVNQISTPSVPEIPPQILPMVEAKETVHDSVPEKPEPLQPITEAIAPPIEQKAPQPEIKKPSYPGGVDPYREPLD